MSLNRIRILPVLVSLALAYEPVMACSPLVVFYSGFGSQKKNALLWKLCKEYNRSGVTKRCLDWPNDETKHIIEHWNSTSAPTPIVLVGHSWGGDTAYKVSRKLHEKMRPTLITLDPVGEIAWTTIGIPLVVGIELRDDMLDSPTSGNWINVHLRASDVRFFLGGRIQLIGPDSCNSIASVGGLYGRQRKANSISFDGDHCDVYEMFSLHQVQKALDDAATCR